MTSVLWG